MKRLLFLVLLLVLLDYASMAQSLSVRCGDQELKDVNYVYTIRQSFFEADTLQFTLSGMNEGSLALMIIPVKGVTYYETTQRSTLQIGQIGYKCIQKMIAPGTKIVMTWNRPGSSSVHYRATVAP